MAGTRYIRYIIFALFALTLVFFISSSSAPAVSQRIQTTTESLKQRLHAPKIKSQKEPLADVHKIPLEGDEDDPQPSSAQKKPEVHRPKKQKGLFPGNRNKERRANATFVSLARNSDVWELAESIKQVEDRFNHQFNYDWVFLNEQEFDDTFKEVTSNLVSGRARYGLIPPEHWSIPEWIDEAKAEQVREDMKKKKIIYGDSLSYRHMCRFESGFFFRQPLMNEYQWYWRVEPNVKYYCDIDYDVFRFMEDNSKKYGFVLSLYEYKSTIETLWDSVKSFIQNHPEHIAEDNSMEIISEDDGATYNLCHFWSNFEVGNLDWLRSEAYLDYFDHLDKEGGFFYERWGDAPVHSIAAALLLQKDEVHFFDDISYWHVPFTHCPVDETFRREKKCRCDPSENFDWNGYSCTAKYFDLHGIPHPDQD